MAKKTTTAKPKKETAPKVTITDGELKALEAIETAIKTNTDLPAGSVFNNGIDGIITYLKGGQSVESLMEYLKIDAKYKSDLEKIAKSITSNSDGFKTALEETKKKETPTKTQTALDAAAQAAIKSLKMPETGTYSPLADENAEQDLNVLGTIAKARNESKDKYAQYEQTPGYTHLFAVPSTDPKDVKPLFYDGQNYKDADGHTIKKVSKMNPDGTSKELWYSVDKDGNPLGAPLSDGKVYDFTGHERDLEDPNLLVPTSQIPIMTQRQKDYEAAYKADTSETDTEIAPFDMRLRRTDAFLHGKSQIPLSTWESTSLVADMIELNPQPIRDPNTGGWMLNPNPKTSTPAQPPKKEETKDGSTDAKDGSTGTQEETKPVTPSAQPNEDLQKYLFDPAGHAMPADRVQYAIVSNDQNNYGALSLINPYSITRLYNSLKNMRFGTNDTKGIHYVDFDQNRMLDIRDQKRFYDIKINDGDDVLSVSNPTTTNIIGVMNNDRWGRTPYSYQDFVFCKYWNRIPNNRLITLRKYAAPTYDNLCWEMMGTDRNKLSSQFTPICTACTFFGGESGNNLKDLLKMSSGVLWEKLEAKIWTVTGDSGTSQEEIADAMLAGGGTNGMGFGGALGSMFSGFGSVMASLGSFMKFTAMCKSPNAFNMGTANAQKYHDNLHDPNDNGPYANRIKGPINRISEVMKRKEGMKFEHKMTLKFAYKARPIGGVNTKVVMLEILSNMLMMCTASAVFWGGGHRFEITPHGYPWGSPGGGLGSFMKKMYNGQIFGENGAIAQSLRGITDIGGEGGGFSMEKVTDFLKGLGAGILGAFGGALSALVGTLKGGGLTTASEWIQKGVDWMKGVAGGNGKYSEGVKTVNNVFSNAQKVWKSNSIKSSTLPHVEGMRALLIGVPVGNWHLTIGNPLNPIAVIGNLICEGIDFEFGEELGPDDFPDELYCTVTLAHGMPRDLAGIESIFNRGAGRIYQAPDYIKLWGKLPSNETETQVDKMTGGTTSRVPHGYVAVEGAVGAGKGYMADVQKSTPLTNSGNWSDFMNAPVNQISIVDYNRYGTISSGKEWQAITLQSAFKGNMHTRHYTDS